jgi:outer membrane protein assembly factor BamE (lipoprotein component of BamABCDE complex)
MAPFNNAMSLMTARQNLLKRLAFGAVVVSACLALGACDLSRVVTRGNLPDPTKLSDLKPGKASKDDIIDAIGSPSSINVFGKETWYYISERTETVAFLAPKVLERHVYVVEFDKNGKMTQIVSLGLDAGREVTHVKRITPTFGQELTVLDQLLGNFRRFKPSKKEP